MLLAVQTAWSWTRVEALGGSHDTSGHAVGTATGANTDPDSNRTARRFPTDRRRLFERVATSLRPGARFAWNALAFDHRIAAGLDGVRQNEPEPHTFRYAVGDNRIDIVRDDGTMSSLWWATKNEWLGLLDVAGLELEALYGGFAGEP
ncbi:MAG TPA: hypothetical protein VF892_07840, partial [Pseudonocardiaceae bacterium]